MPPSPPLATACRHSPPLAAHAPEPISDLCARCAPCTTACAADYAAACSLYPCRTVQRTSAALPAATGRYRPGAFATRSEQLAVAVTATCGFAACLSPQLLLSLLHVAPQDADRPIKTTSCNMMGGPMAESVNDHTARARSAVSAVTTGCVPRPSARWRACVCLSVSP